MKLNERERISLRLAVEAASPTRDDASAAKCGERELGKALHASEALGRLLAQYGYPAMGEEARRRLYTYFYDLGPFPAKEESADGGAGAGEWTPVYARQTLPVKRRGVTGNTKIGREERNTAFYDYDELLRKLGKFLEGQTEKRFGQYVTELIASRGMDHIEVYKRAGFSRQDFSRIINSSTISRSNVFNLAIGLRLTVEETEELFRRAGYGLRRDKFDSIVLFFIREGIYDIGEINLYLYEYGQKLLTDNLDTGSGDRGIK